MSDVPTILCRLGPSAFGIAHGPLSDSLIVTVQGDGILEYDTSTQERTATRSLGTSRLSFVSPVVFNTHSQTYFAAVTNASKAQQVLSWQASAPAGTLDRVATTVNLPKPVHSIHPTTCNPRLPEEGVSGQERPSSSATTASASTSGQEEHGGVFVVFADGSVALENYYSNGRKGESISGEGRVVAVSCHRGKLAVLTVGEGSNYNVAIYGFVDGGLVRLGLAPLTPPGDASSTVSSISLRGQALSVLWSQGTLCSHYMFPHTDTGFSLRLQATRRLAGVEEAPPQPKTPVPKNGKKAAKATGKRKSIALEDDHTAQQSVVVAAPGSIIATVNWLAGDENARRKRLRLNVVDGMYGTARRSQELPLEAEAGGKAEGAALQALHMGSDSQQVALLAGGSVLLLQLQDPPPTLASLVGALSFGGRTPLQQAAKAAFHAEEWPRLRPPAGAEGKARPSWVPGGDARDALPPATLREIAVPLEPRDDGGASAGTEDVESEAAELHDAICSPSTFASRESAAAFVDRLLEKAPKTASRLKSLPRDLFSHLLLCLAETGYWEEVERIVGMRPLDSLAHAPGLLPLLTAAGRHSLLAKILPAVKDACLEDLLASLEGILTLKGDIPGKQKEPHLEGHKWLQEAAAQAQAAAEGQAARNGAGGSAKLQQDAADSAALVDSFSAMECLLHPFVATGIDRVMLVKLLRRLGMRPCLQLATYLLTWLNLFLGSGVSQKGRVLPKGGCLPSLQHVILWCSAVIDAHLIAFSSDQDAAKVALEMQKAVAAHRSAIPSLSSLLGMVDHIRRGGPPPKQLQNDSLYSVELLDLTIRE